MKLSMRKQCASSLRKCATPRCTSGGSYGCTDTLQCMQANCMANAESNAGGTTARLRLAAAEAMGGPQLIAVPGGEAPWVAPRAPATSRASTCLQPGGDRTEAATPTPSPDRQAIGRRSNAGKGPALKLAQAGLNPLAA